MSFQELVKLTQKKHRREMGLCIVEGEKLVREHRDHAVAVFSRGAVGDNATALKPAEFDRVSNLETPEGVLAVVPIPKSTAITYPYLVLDGVQDAGNVGTILRTAKAFGFDTVFCVNCADPWSQKVLRSAMGAQFGLNVYENFDYANVGGELYIADMPNATEKNTPLSARPKNKFGIVLGNEGHGVGAEIRELPHKIVSIPQKKGVESLNVSVAGAIILYVWSQ